MRGRELMSGLPKTVILSPSEVRERHRRAGHRHRRLGLSCLGEAPPELAQDLIEQGIHLVGGGGAAAGLDLRLAKETEVPVHLVDQPLESVVLGAGRCIESYDELRVMFMGARR